MFAQNIKIAKFNVSNNDKALIIAEVGVNHEGNYENCLKLIKSASKSGADLVKLQFADPNTDYDNDTFSHKLYKKTLLSKEQIYNIYKYSRKNKINIFTTFGKKNYDFFKKLNQCCFKVSSSLMHDYYFINDLLKLNKAVILSTGVSDIKDIDLVLNLISKQRNKKIGILHCRSLYPTNFNKLNLSRISYLRKRYGIITGFSDHSIGTEAAAASIHYGAKIIEKHFTFNENKKGYDHNISLNPKNFEKMVNKIRENEKMIGKYDFSIKDNVKDFQKIKKVYRSFVLNKNKKMNNFLHQGDFSLKRTNSIRDFEFFHKLFPYIIKKKLKKNCSAGKKLKLSDFKK